MKKKWAQPQAKDRVGASNKFDLYRFSTCYMPISYVLSVT